LCATMEVISSSCVGHRRKALSFRSVRRKNLVRLITIQNRELTNCLPLRRRWSSDHSFPTAIVLKETTMQVLKPLGRSVIVHSYATTRPGTHLGFACAYRSTSLFCLGLAGQGEASGIPPSATDTVLVRGALSYHHTFNSLT